MVYETNEMREEQSRRDKARVTIQVVSNGFIVGYPMRRKVYAELDVMLDEIRQHLVAQIALHRKGEHNGQKRTEETH